MDTGEIVNAAIANRDAEIERLRWALEEIIQSCDLDDEAMEPGDKRSWYLISPDLIEQARKALFGR